MKTPQGANPQRVRKGGWAAAHRMDGAGRLWQRDGKWQTFLIKFGKEDLEQARQGTTVDLF